MTVPSTGANHSPGAIELVTHAASHGNAQGAGSGQAPADETSRGGGNHPVRTNTRRDIGLARKLAANFAGEVPPTIIIAAVNLLVNVVSAAIRHSDIGQTMKPAGISAGAQAGGSFTFGAALTAASHYLGRVEKHIYSQNASVKEEFQERAVVSGLFATTSSILISLGFNIGGTAAAKQAINGKGVGTAVVEEVVSALVSTGVISAGVALLCMRDNEFRRIVESTLSSMTSRLGLGKKKVEARLDIAVEDVERAAAAVMEGARAARRPPAQS